MHPTAILNCKNFFENYSKYFDNNSQVKIIEIGSQDVNGTLKDLCPKNYNYIGVDFVVGKNVDVVLEDPYVLPFKDEEADIIISSSCFEHSEMFWVVFLEVMRVLKPKGIFYLNVPSNGMYHRYPVDCWRFFPDSGKALVSWARYNKINATLLESFVCAQLNNGAKWNDFVAVFLKDELFRAEFKDKIIDKFKDFSNGRAGENEEVINLSEMTEDHKRLNIISQVANNQINVK